MNSPRLTRPVALLRTMIALLLLWTHPTVARAGSATLPTGFQDSLIAGNLDEPVGIARVPDPTNASAIRLLYVEQRTARVMLLVGGTQFVVGTVPGVISTAYERGLLGIAVDPRWPASPYIYIHATDNRSGNHIVVSRFTLTGDLGFTGNGQLQFNATSRYDLLRSPPDNAGNHNGGTVRFGPDGTLFVSLGDDALGCPAQDRSVLAGKILRLDVTRLPSTPGGPPPIAQIIPPGNPFPSLPDSNSKLVWAYGLRNPFRFHVDDVTGNLLIADVGEATWEELDLGTTGGLDYGWPIREGPTANVTCPGTPPALTGPIYWYDHNAGVVIISVGIYHVPSGGAHAFPPEYEGDAFLLDYGTGILRRLHNNAGSWTIAAAVSGQPSAENWGEGMANVSDALEMPDGSIYYCRQFEAGANSGEIRRIAGQGNTSVPNPDPIPQPALSFSPPAPNPNRGTVSLNWNQPRAAEIDLTIFDTFGRQVRELCDGCFYTAGPHQTGWNGRDDKGSKVSPGVYVARIRIGDSTKQFLLTVLR